MPHIKRGDLEHRLHLVKLAIERWNRLPRPAQSTQYMTDARYRLLGFEAALEWAIGINSAGANADAYMLHWAGEVEKEYIKYFVIADNKEKS